MLTLVVILVAATCGAGAIARPNLMKKYPASGQMVDAGGFKMHIQCSGQGSPAVILVAGLDDFSIMWSLVQPHLAERAVLFDIRQERPAPFGIADLVCAARSVEDTTSRKRTVARMRSVTIGPRAPVTNS